MARQETDKEDLIRDATALVERAEIVCDGWESVITTGFFRDGRCAIYFDQDPFYQFDSSGRLRRAFEAGFLYRSQGTALARIERHRSGTENAKASAVVLCRTDLSASVLVQFHMRMTRRLIRLHDAIRLGAYSVRRACPSGGGIPAQTLPLLATVLQRPADDFLAPPVAPR